MEQHEITRLKEVVASIPKQKNLAIFFGRAGGSFIDNVKYFFLHCVQHQPQLECYFISFDKKEAASLHAQGLPAVWVNEPEAPALMAKAGLVICDDFSWKNQEFLWALTEQAVSIQLWHGIPLKAIGFPEIESTVNMNPAKAAHLTFSYSGYDTVVSTSPFFTENAFARAFKADAFVESGYPRNDVLHRRPSKLDMINTDSNLYGELVRFRKQGGKTVFYMPTFRDNGGGPFEDGAIDIMRLSHFCQQHNVAFLCKFHPYIPVKTGTLPPNVIMVSPQSDAYPLLPLCDALITDYSSIYFDFLHVDRPIIFYAYDLAKYMAVNRELLFDFDTMTPGHKATTQDELYSAIENIVVNNNDSFANDRNKLKELSFSNIDGNSAKRLAEHIISTYL
ncbi:CDP-glycerol glycerophosphotransferase family protein [Desulfovibrio mangrovi]|uniref:CDP-glycerol glycerophosphotransferase family protein n=1 Tax=Desulfovibrio mangrovi TaxID=2976983 RepID=UPI002247A378|nr:CDP-glycerol glycerophosphotransferase family protein [Desulfovibrio mangrovi]UZP66897.1 CDP-glycerol glycerophosphotransferase family protein [Desulfovibrio mangrovi]